MYKIRKEAMQKASMTILEKHLKKSDVWSDNENYLTLRNVVEVMTGREVNDETTKNVTIQEAYDIIKSIYYGAVKFDVTNADSLHTDTIDLILYLHSTVALIEHPSICDWIGSEEERIAYVARRQRILTACDVTVH